MKIILITFILLALSTYLFTLPYFLLILKDGFKDYVYHTKKEITENEELLDAVQGVFFETLLILTGFCLLVIIFLLPFINIFILREWTGGIKNPFYKGDKND